MWITEVRSTTERDSVEVDFISSVNNCFSLNSSMFQTQCHHFKAAVLYFKVCGQFLLG